MPPLVEYCMANVSASTLERLQRSDCSTRATMCLDHCGECCSGAFLVVDGEFREGASHRSLLADVTSSDAGDVR